MANKSSLQKAQNLLQKAQDLLEQNQLTEQVIELLEKAADEFEEQAEWHLYLNTYIQWAIFYTKTFQYTIAGRMIINALEKVSPFVSSLSMEVGNAYNQLAICAYNQADYPISRHYFRLALQVYITNYGEQYIDTAKTYSNLGNCMYAEGKYEEALEFYEKSLQVRQVVLPPNHPHFAFSYSALGRCHNLKRNYKKALLYFQQALSIRIHQYDTQHLMVSYSYTDIATCYINLWDYSKAREYSEKALAIRLKAYPKGHPTVAYCYAQIANMYMKEGNFLEAISPYESAIKLHLDLLGESHPDLGYIYAQLGRCLLEVEPPKSLAYLQKGLKIYEQIYGNHHKETARILDYIGRFYQKQKQYEQALEVYQRTINSLCEVSLEEIDEAVIYQKPSLDHYLSAQRLSKPLVSKAEIFCELYKQNHELREIQAAFEHAQQLVRLLDQMRNQQSAEDEQLFLSEETATFYDLAIEIAWMLYHKTRKKDVLKTMFLFVEKGKAMVLLSSLQKNSAKLQSNIPTAILEEAKSLEVKISELKKQLKITSDKSLFHGLQKQLFHATLQSETLTNQLEREYPEYYQLKYKMPTVGIEELQKVLKEGQVKGMHHSAALLLSYYVGEKHIYIFEVTADTYDVYRTEKPDDLEDKILDFQDAINLMDVEDYVEVSVDLYGLLLAPILEKNGLPVVIPQKMIVLRHDLLDYLPFEALLTTDNVEEIPSLSFANLPYLIHYYEISYHYSSALLLNKIRQSQTTATRQNSFLGFAPVSFNENDIEGVELELESQNGRSKVLRSNRAGEVALQNLPNTETEVKEVYQLFQDKSLAAKAFLYGSASKANLIRESSKHKYLLISTHGFVEDGESGLSGIYLAKKGAESEVKSQEMEVINEQLDTGNNMPKHSNAILDPNVEIPLPRTQTLKDNSQPENTNYLLYTSDTYHLDLQADLVVLSSCSSGIGKLQKGEGMMAVNRGFLYAGASNIIFTQFDIPDHSSSLLVKKLFEYILEGDDYSASLRKAKLYLLEKEASSVQDWAGYLLIGV